MKITKQQLRRIIRETMTFDQRDSDRWDDSGSSGWDDLSSYDMGYDDWLNGNETPMRPKDSGYMAGWEAASIDQDTLSQQRHQTNDQEKIKEALAFTEEYDDDSALKGDQSKLPDNLQKAIIDDTVEKREDQEEVEKEEKNESVSIENMPDNWRQILGNCLGE